MIEYLENVLKDYSGTHDIMVIFADRLIFATFTEYRQNDNDCPSSTTQVNFASRLVHWTRFTYSRVAHHDGGVASRHLKAVQGEASKNSCTFWATEIESVVCL